jgi:hypothetical protein
MLSLEAMILKKKGT